MQAITPLILMLLLSLTASAQHAGVFVLELKPGNDNFALESIQHITGLDTSGTRIKRTSPTEAIGTKQFSEKKQSNPVADTFPVTIEVPLSPSGNYLSVVKKLVHSELFNHIEFRVPDEMMLNPNDPLADSALADSVVNEKSSKLSQFYLHKIRAYEAWNVTTGDTNVSVAVVDGSFDITHEDLVGNVQYNHADPIDGVDNDGDGLTDNYAGWNVVESNHILSATGMPHGNIVSGACSATPNNGKGLAGTGFNCRLYPVRVGNATQILAGYQGITFAANRNMPVINTSWGSGLKNGKQPSTAEQDVITNAVLVKDAVVVASAGNVSVGNTDYFFPASYDHVIAAAQVDVKDRAISSATYSPRVDVCVPNRYSATLTANGYTSNGAQSDGSSVSATVVSGAVALVRSKFPQLNALQAAERIRRTCDVIDTISDNAAFKGMMGYGRLNMYRAVSDTGLQSIRMYQRLSDSINIKPPYASVPVSFRWVSLLDSISNAKITLRSLSNRYSIQDSVYIAGHLSTLQQVDNSSSPFTFAVPARRITEDRVPVQFKYTGDGGFDYYQNLLLPFSHHSLLNTDSSGLNITFASGGRIGYNGVSLLSLSNGLGVNFADNQLIYDAGLVMGTSASKLSSNIRGTGVRKDDDFYMTGFEMLTSPHASQVFRSRFNDSASTTMIGVEVEQTIYAGIPGETGDDFVLINYKVTNNSAANIDTLFMGLFNGWEINNLNNNHFLWDSALTLGYARNLLADSLLAGVAIISPTGFSTYYGFDWNNVLDGINLYNGVSKNEKWSLINGKFKREVGLATAPNGTDVDGYVGGAITQLMPGNSKEITFAYVAGRSKSQLDEAVAMAQALFVQLNTSATPPVNDTSLCKDALFSFGFDNPTLFDVYDTLPGLRAPLAIQTSSYQLDSLKKPARLYLVGTDKMYPSDTVSFSIDTLYTEVDFVHDASGLSVTFSPSHTSQVISWIVTTGDTLFENNPTYAFTEEGTYPITLNALDTNGCERSMTKNIDVIALAEAQNNIPNNHCNIFPNPSSGVFTIDCVTLQDAEVVWELYDITGRKILDGIALDAPFSIKTTVAGVYFLSINTGAFKSTYQLVVNP